ncbi:30S ribosomal protein S16 [Candidatus Mycoplasma haematobovis]|uniref:Small ribosomal subunit protein bS16 n=1 Tax=Candidatus Mycoplasma haematobovis TaxID=432608 RepID=A0A1A9QDG4_9MOLU|nr:30S ribosomal protein S16 [Candidatus Mycoplasma haematobovis]OAL10124.1 30S ribosomal protein S16 [Candidatus Mycoplasma haematobovis]
MLKIRLLKMGRKALPIYRIVVMDSRKRRDGAYIELVGTYNPIKKDVRIDKEIYSKYISNGAQPTEVVERLFKSYGN